MGARETVDEFLAEAEELLERLSQDLARVGEGIEDGEVSPDLINGIFRDAHSIKGLSGMFGFSDIAELAHHLETLLDRLRLGRVPLNGILLDTLFLTVEGLGGMVRGKADDPDFTLDIQPHIKRIESLLAGPSAAERISLEDLNLDPALLNVLTEYEEHRLQENLRLGSLLVQAGVTFPLDSFDSELSRISAAIKDVGEIISTLPGVSNDDPDALAFRIIFACRLPLEKLEALPEIAECELTVLSRGRETTEADVGESDAPIPVPTRPAAPEDTSLRSISRSVRVDIGKLDLLMNIVGELGLAKGQIAQVADDLVNSGFAQGRELGKAVHSLERRLAELQKAVMDVRMVPVRQLFEKMGRIIRRMARELGKKVELETFGGDTEFDKLIAEELADPLMHIIRNALDHGLESSAERLTAGKPEIGRVELRAAQRGNHVVLEIRDDGRGIDPELLRRKGVEKGLIDESAQLTRHELFNLLFQPGFSTRDEVSEYSGRGVGMDVVKNNISALSGMIELESTPGEGTCISLTLPITLAIIKALVVQVRGRDFALPLTSVLETLMIEPGLIQTIEGQEVMELRRQTLPLLRLSQLFGIKGESSDAGGFVVVAGFAERRIGIIVEELRGQQDVVIKSLGRALSFVRGIAGAADLGNQKTVLVLDVSSLIIDTLRGEGGLHV